MSKKLQIMIICFHLGTVLSLSAAVPLQTSPYWQTSEEDVYSTGMVWEDGNRDGYIDVFYSNGNDIVLAPNFVYISNYGTLPENASWYSANAEYSGHCSVGDIDDNGYPDLAVSNFIGFAGFSQRALSNVYLNFGGRLNTSPDWYPDDSVYTFSCALGDVDGDGDLDLAVANGEGYTEVNIRDQVFYNIDGTLETSPTWQAALATQAMDVTWGDVDNDGDLDLALCYDDLGANLYYNNMGTLETTPSWNSVVTDAANTVIFGDINGDGWLDLIVAFNYQNSGAGYYHVFYNNGAGVLESYPSWRSSDGGYGSALALYDYDRDGDDDLAAGRWWDRVRIYENLGDSLTSNPVWRADAATVVEALAWVDVDGDGVELFADTFMTAADRKLFYTAHHPLFSVDSVRADGVLLDDDDYCYQLESGWISLGQEPAAECIVYYKYSHKNDLAMSNWDTFNMVFANTNKPIVDIHADTGSGWVPFTVQFSDSSVGGSDWRWYFGDGDSAMTKNPVHVYQQGGFFDVALGVDLPDGYHHRLAKGMVTVFADTLAFPEVTCGSGETVKVPICLTNCHPLHTFNLPLTFSGEMTLGYVDFDTDSCRTDYFANVKLVAFDPTNKKLVFEFIADQFGTNPPLEPGSGPILNIYFQHVSGTGVNYLDTVYFAYEDYALNADYVTYQPRVIRGQILGADLVRGDANGDLIINILDITFLINYLYKGGPAPVFYAGDVNDDGIINLLDITYLIEYLYMSGPPPPAG